MQHEHWAVFYWYQGRSYFCSACYQEAVTWLRVCIFQLQRKAVIHDMNCCQSLVGMRAPCLCRPPRSGWHSAENIPADTELSGSACSSCIQWAVHPLIAITVSQPTFTGCLCPPQLGYPILSTKWRMVKKKTVGHLWASFLLSAPRGKIQSSLGQTDSFQHWA